MCSTLLALPPHGIFCARALSLQAQRISRNANALSVYDIAGSQRQLGRFLFEDAFNFYFMRYFLFFIHLWEKKFDHVGSTSLIEDWFCTCHCVVMTTYFLLLLGKLSIWFTEKHFFKIIKYFFNTLKCVAKYVI